MVYLLYQGLNDRDIISVGTKDTAVSAKDKKDVFVYMIRYTSNNFTSQDPVPEAISAISELLVKLLVYFDK